MATLPTPANDEPEGMDDNELASILAAHEARSVGYYTSEIADEQAKAINYYYGIMDDVPALDGCSKVVDHSVAVMVDNALAAVLKPFVSADEVVMFDPRGPEDVEQAEQATEYVNYIIQCDNPGFMILHNWFKDALLTKLGAVKVYWEDQSRNETQAVPMDAMQLEMARKAPEYLSEQASPDGTFMVQLQKMVEDGRVRIEPVPPEEFLISPLSRDIESTPYAAHRPSDYTRSDLIEMGVPAEVVEGLSAFAGSAGDEARSQARYRDEDWGSVNRQIATNDKSRDIIGVIDEYVRVDYDGDGVSELRRVIRVDDTILFNEPAEEIPFALLCPCPMPHKVYGVAVADQAIEGQRVSTAVLRQTLDNLYKTNNPRPVVADAALGPTTMNDIGDNAPGAIIRVKQAGQMDWAAVPFTAQHSFSMLEYTATQTEERTGVQRKGNGLNPETLEKNSRDTATAAAIDENSRNERAEMIARIFAETGVKRLFKLILSLVVRHQPKERVIRLRNKWVEIDPRGWNPEMDVSISVGLGVGNKSELIGQAQSVLQTMAELQQTPYGYLLKPEHVHKAVKRMFVATGIKDADNYIADPATEQPPQPEPDPKAKEAEAKMAEAQAKLAMDQQKAQAAQAQAAQQFQFEQQLAGARLQAEQQQGQTKLQMQAAIEQAKIQLEQAKASQEAHLAQQRAEFEAQLALRDQQIEVALQRERLNMEREHMAEKAAMERKAMSKERKGGDLSK